MTQKADSEDLDELLADLTDVYDLNLPDNAFLKAVTIGDVYDVVWFHLPLDQKSGGKCGSLVAFHCIRQYLKKAYPDIDWRPNTRLATIPGFRYEKLQDDLIGWDLPSRRVEAPVWGLAACCALAAGNLAEPSIHAYAWLVAILVFGFTAFHLHKSVFRRGRPAVATVGSLATYIAVHNLQRMKDEGVTLSRKTLWRIFEAYFEGTITRETLFT